MRQLFRLVVSFIAVAAAVLCWVPSTTLADFLKLPSPPADALAGQSVDGVQIGLWTEKSVYRGNEIRNVWMLDRNDRSSATTIGVGGNLFDHSFLHVSSKHVVVAELPVGSGIDGMVNPASRAGGISEILANLPSGIYQLIWKTSTVESNTITIEIRND